MNDKQKTELARWGLLSATVVLVACISGGTSCETRAHARYEAVRLAELKKEVELTEERQKLAVEETKRKEKHLDAFVQCLQVKPTRECEQVFFPEHPERLSEETKLQLLKLEEQREKTRFEKIDKLLQACWRDSGISDGHCDNHVRNALKEL